MSEQNPSRLWSAFRLILKARWLVIAVYAILLGPAAYFAMQVPQDNSIDRLIVRDDPDYLASRAFAKVFGDSEYIILLAEAPDPFAGPVVKRIDEMENRLRSIPRVSVNSALTIFRRAKAGFSGTEAELAAFRKFATGTKLFSRQGLVGDHFISLALVLSIKNTDERQETLGNIEKAIADTQSAIAEIKKRSRERFTDAFYAINTNFKQMFQELFGGGQGEMRLIDETDVLESGIEIIAQPPGKRLQNVLLLSGGEKAMTAMALVLAIFKYRPSPFCLLDEVDAPLDEMNIGRFADKVLEMSNNTQFMVITHSKRTMEAARTLYGVTMEDPGVSKLISVRLS